MYDTFAIYVCAIYRGKLSFLLRPDRNDDFIPCIIVSLPINTSRSTTH